MLCALFLGLAGAAPQLSAQAPPADAGDEASQLEALLAQETELATKTRVNADFVPGMVTVLSGDDLEALGIRNVWEALALVPGVQVVRDHESSPLVLVRGINFIFNSGNIKILVDSVPFNQEGTGVTDLNTAILFLPIQEVERIEFMRGPGSAIHGDAAYLGLLNIITRRSERRVFASGMSSEIAGGAQLSWSGASAKESAFGVGFSGYRTSDVDLHGPTTGEDRAAFGRLSFAAQGLSLSLQALDEHHAIRAGDDDVATRERRLAAEARYRRDVSPALHLEGYANVLLNDDESIGVRNYEGRTAQAGVDASWRAPGGHRVLFTLGYTSAELTSAHLFGPPIFDIHLAGIERHWFSFGVQDEWSIARPLTLTAGIRLDDFDDIGNEVTSRVALVWNVDDHQVLKAQYAEGFRAPAFFELYATGSARNGLQPEHVATTELSYILRLASSVARVTLFRSVLDDLIQPPHVPGGSFSNESSAKTKGVELELTQQLGRKVRASANVSYADPEDTRATRDVYAASKWLANVMLVADPLKWLRASVRWSHVGERGGFSGTGTVPGFDTVDLSASAQNLVAGLTLRATLKNVFDDEVLYITTLPPPFPIIRKRYDGRTLVLDVSYRF